VRLVIDTNVVVSAFINPHGKPSQIMKMILSRKAELCYNTAILCEYESVMYRPKFSGKIDSGNVRRFINLLKSIGISFNPLPDNTKLHTAEKMPGESDRTFYDTARGSGSVLISEDFPKLQFLENQP
jgi:putative PIN family toxin of toxin-antitoxin system